MRKDRSLVIISSFVLVMHGVLLFFTYDGQFLKKFEAAKPIQRLMVQTISLEPSPPVKKAIAARNREPEVPEPLEEEPEEPTAAIEEPTPPRPPAEPTPKNEKKAAKKPKPKQAKTKAKQVPVKTPKKKAVEKKQVKNETTAALKQQQKLLGRAQQSIAKIGQKKDAPSNRLSVEALPNPPQLISDLQIDAVIEPSIGKLSDKETNYRQELASRLKLLLRLPEYGEIRLKLTLEGSGKVAKLVILSAESQANRSYIEKTISSLKFPSFGTFNGGNEYTFTITLSNE